MTVPKPAADQAEPLAQTGPAVDRKALRAELNRRYEHTLRRLGK